MKYRNIELYENTDIIRLKPHYLFTFLQPNLSLGKECDEL